MSRLDDPLTLKSGVVLPHRVALAPLTNCQSNPDGTLHDDEFAWLTRRAGAFSLVSTCAAFVSEEGHAWKGQLGIAGDHHLPGLTRLAAGHHAAIRKMHDAIADGIGHSTRHIR
ncbi:MAG: NADH:flavin oxidoreductase, partial [Myxococcota bacterium]